MQFTQKVKLKYRPVIFGCSALLLFLFSFQVHAGGVKIIIKGEDHHFSNSDKLHNYNRFNRNRIGYGDHYYDYRYYKKRPGYAYRGYGYSNNFRNNYRKSYRNRGSYCPY